MPGPKAGHFCFWWSHSALINRDAAPQWRQETQQFQGFNVAEMPRPSGKDTSLWQVAILVYFVRD
jgi:hypothetical protein